MKRGLTLGLFLGVVLISLWCIVSVSATDYYVNATSGNDSLAGTSPTLAWKTISKVNGESFSPGDNIYFERGQTWNEQLTVNSSGNSTHQITFGAYGSGAKPIIDGGSVRAACVFGTDFDYITVDDIKVTGWLHAGILDLRGTNWIVQNCTAEDGGNDVAPDNGIKIYTQNGNALVTGIEIRNNTIGTINTAEIYDVGAVGIQLLGVDGAIVSGNTVAPTNMLGIRFGRAGAASADNTGCIAENNVVSATYGPHISFSHTDNSIMRYNNCYGSKGGGLSVAYSSDNNELSYNLVYNNSMEVGLSSYNGIDVTQDSQTGKIYNNVVFKVPRHCLMIDDVGGAANGWIVKNNVFDASQNTDIGVGGDKTRKIAIGVRGAGITWTSDNNILRGQSYESDADDDPASTTAVWVGSIGDGAGTLYNFVDWKTNSNQDANSVSSDPLFTDAPANDFTLTSDSPAIDAGVNLGASYDDGLDSGSVWPNSVLTLDQDDYGGGWEIGAYVYVDTVTPTITFSCSPTSVTTGETVTCSCSVTDDVDSSPNVSYTANPSTSATGTFTTTCTVTDSSGNSASSTTTYTVEQTSGSDTPTTTWTTYTITEGVFEQGYTKELGIKNRIKVQIEAEDHFIGVVSISESQATIEISSDPVQVILDAGEDAKVDVTDNDFYDVHVLLNGITNNKANVTIQKIHEEVPEGGTGVETTGVETTGEQPLEEGKSKWWLWLVLALIVVVLVIIIIVIYKHKRRGFEKISEINR